MLDLGMMERARADAEEPEKLVLTDEAGEPYPVKDGESEPAFLMVKGADCKAVRAARRAAWARLAVARREIKADDKLSEEEVDRRISEQMETLALDPEFRRPVATAAVADWGYVKDAGTPLDFNPENLSRLLAFERILGQVERKMRAHEGFSRPRLKG